MSKIRFFSSFLVFVFFVKVVGHNGSVCKITHFLKHLGSYCNNDNKNYMPPPPELWGDFIDDPALMDHVCLLILCLALIYFIYKDNE